MIQLAPWFGWAAFIGVLYFFLVAAIPQFLRPDYSFVGTPLSFYLLGPYSGWLRAAFYILAAAIVLLATGCYLGSSHNARRVTTLILFLVGASGVVVTATFPTDTNNSALQSVRTKPRPVGLVAGKFSLPDSFFDPLPNDVLTRFEAKNA